MAFVRSFKSKMDGSSEEKIEETAVPAQSNLSFKIKKVDQKVQKVNREENSRKDLVKSIEGKKVKIRSESKTEKKKELIIPHIKVNKWRIPNEDKPASSLDDLAIKEIIDESTKANENWEKREEKDRLIPLLIQNKILEGFETEEKLQVTLRPDSSTLADYDNVPVEEYGYALLKGMGWKPGGAIGDKNKKYVESLEVVRRPKGVGLGTKQNSSKKQQNSEDEDLVLTTGSYVYIEKGQKTGQYGEVEGLDEENGRVFVKLVRNNENIAISELFIRVVSEKEFNKESRIINKRKYEEHKNRSFENRYNSRRDYKYKHVDYHDRYYDRKPEKYRDSYPEEKSRKRKYSSDDSDEYDRNVPDPWLMPLLRVRCIDDNFKGGKYYNTKMIIEDVLTPTSCICKTENGNILEDVNSSMLETVIPRTEDSYVMIVQGEYKRQAHHLPLLYSWIFKYFYSDIKMCQQFVHLLYILLLYAI